MTVAHNVGATWTILVAAGEGRRFGGPKQLQPLGGRRVIDWAFDVAAGASHGVVVVVAAEQVQLLRDGPGALSAESEPGGTLLDPEGGAGGSAGGAAPGEGSPGGASPGARPQIIVTAGGATRSESVRAGIAATPGDAGVIVVHDAARPLATGALFAAVAAAVAAGADGAVPAVAVTDTIRHTDDGPLDRSRLRAVQTPQAFRADALRHAHAAGGEATDDATLVESAGGSVHLVTGDPDNLKITTPGDLEIAEALLAARAAAGEGEGRPSSTATGDVTFSQQVQDASENRPPAEHEHTGSVPLVGIGFDVHPFSDDPDRALVLGGVVFDGERGLAGHSDADAVAHACCDAILGVVGLGDIGSLFPDDDDRWRNADSIALLAEAAARVRRTGRRIGNIDCTVVAERPRLAPRRDEMQARLSAAAGAPVTVRGKRAESLGAVGRGEGIACWAVAVLT